MPNRVRDHDSMVNFAFVDGLEDCLQSFLHNRIFDSPGVVEGADEQDKGGYEGFQPGAIIHAASRKVFVGKL